jgi:futalosine hydrolase
MGRSVLVCVATAPEGALLHARLGGPRRTIARVDVRRVVTGVGPLNPPHALTRAMVPEGADVVVSCGVGGAYPGSGLALGDVVCAASETYGDLGASSPDGFLDLAALGFPLVAGDPPLFGPLPLQCFPVARRVPFVTCSTCTGTGADARAIAARTGGAVESMEGAAIVHVARIEGVDAAEVRGVSNAVGDRDRSRWRLREAAGAAQAALLAWIEAGAPC